MMRVQWIISTILTCAPFAVHAQLQGPEAARQLVRAVAYNEMHDHQRHGYWRYWIEKQSPREARVEEQVETGTGR